MSLQLPVGVRTNIHQRLTEFAREATETTTAEPVSLDAEFESSDEGYRPRHRDDPGHFKLWLRFLNAKNKETAAKQRIMISAVHRPEMKAIYEGDLAAAQVELTELGGTLDLSELEAFWQLVNSGC